MISKGKGYKRPEVSREAARTDPLDHLKPVDLNPVLFIMETVLVVGATGHIGVSAIKAALRSKRNVLAIVRNQESANKLFKHVGSADGITTVEADVVSDTGVKGVVDQVRAGKLPAFQHVYSCGTCLETSRASSTVHKKIMTDTGI
jgi:short-subunit dehydrogenase